MKITCLYVLCLLSFFGCTRSNNIKPPNPHDSTFNLTSYLLDTVKIYSLGPKEIYYSIAKFNYNAQEKLISINSTGADTTASLAVYADTQHLVFNYSGTDTLPSSYTASDNLNIYPTQDNNENHVLNYDITGMVIRDSLTNGGPNPLVANIYYGPGYVVKSDEYSVDSVYLLSNNMVRQNSYFGQPATNLSEQDIFQYSAYENPYYTNNLSRPLGTLFPTTFLSANLLSQKSFSFYGGTQTTLNYTWTTNSAGKVIYGVGIDASTGKPAEYYWFVYK